MSTANPSSTRAGASDVLLTVSGRAGVSDTFAYAVGAVLALTVFCGPLDFSSGGAAMNVALDPLVMIKLAVSGLATLVGMAGVLRSAVVRDLLSSIPALLVLGILVLAGFAAPGSVSAAAVPTTLINFGYLLFAATAVATLSLRAIAITSLVAMSVSTVLALGLYVLVPDYGVFPELLPGGQIVERLGGTAHPNSVSRTVFLAAIMTVFLYRRGSLGTVTTLTLVLVLASAAWLAWSRTAILAGTVAMLGLTADRWRGRWGVSLMVAAAIAGLAALTILFAVGQEDQLIGRVLASLTKTGRAEEITSGTGRREIWAYALELIRQRPVIGHGFNSAPILMVDHSQSTHNALLHVALSGGIVAGVLMIALLAWNSWTAATTEQPLIRSLALFLLLSCLMEETVLETFPGPCTTLWLVVCLHPVFIAIQDLRSRVGRSQPV